MADLGSKFTASWPIKLAPGARPGQKKTRKFSETEESKVHVNYEIRRKGRGCKKVWRVGGNDYHEDGVGGGGGSLNIVLQHRYAQETISTSHGELRTIDCQRLLTMKCPLVM